MRVEASPVSETTRRDASALGSCEQRKFAPAPIWTEAMLAALKWGVKGGKWHSLIDKVSRRETLELGWAQAERNAGAAGVDGVSVERFAQAQDRYLAELARGLRDGSYHPEPVRRVYIPKGKGQRPLSIPAVKDRVVQAALKLVIEPIFEHEFEPRSYGFRPGLGCKDALREVDRHLKEGRFWVVDADLLPPAGCVAVVAHSSTPQSIAPPAVAPDGEVRHPVASARAHLPPATSCALGRHHPRQEPDA